MPNHPSDPRSDKLDDHAYWQHVLECSWRIEQSLYYILHYIRCGGAEIGMTASSFALKSGEWTPEEWVEIKQTHLAPHQKRLTYILKIARTTLAT